MNELPTVGRQLLTGSLWRRSTCPSLDELRSLVRSAERRHHDLIQATRGQRGQLVMSYLAAQRDRRENPSVIEEKRHLEAGRSVGPFDSVSSRFHSDIKKYL